jgi:tetratricopeptide (TPR) repeat protein
MRAIKLVGVASLFALIFMPAWADRGDDCARGGDPDLAIKACTDIIEFPSRAGKVFTSDSISTAYNNRGLAYASKGMVQQALADFAKSLSGNPTKLTYHNRASLYIQQREYASALRDAEAGLRLQEKADINSSVLSLTENRQDANLHYDKALAFYGLGRKSETISELQDAVRLAPSDSKVRSEAQAMLRDLGGAAPMGGFSSAPLNLPSTPSVPSGTFGPNDTAVNQRLMDILSNKPTTPPAAPAPSNIPTGGVIVPQSQLPPGVIGNQLPRSSGNAASPPKTTEQLWKEFDERDPNAKGRPLTPDEAQSLGGTLRNLQDLCKQRPELKC